MAAPQIRFRPFLEASGIYAQGLSAPSVNTQGQLSAGHSWGAGLVWGIGGVKSWRHTKLGLDYRGSVTHYTQLEAFDSVDQSMMIGVTHQFSPHISIELRESAGLTNRDFGQRGLRQTVPFDPAMTYVPTTDYFDNRTVFSTSTAALQWQKTARLSFLFGGDGFIVRRRSSALYDSDGLTARWDMQYRVSRYSTIGVNYSYLHFKYGAVKGATDAHGLAVSYSRRLSRTLEFSGYGGAYRVESTLLQQTRVDPAIEALLGITSIQQVVYRINYAPMLAARLSRTFRRGVFFLSGGHSLQPGNGVFMTSTASTVLTGYSYTGLRRWSFAVSGGYLRANSIGLVSGMYNGAQEGLQVSRQIGRSFHFLVSYSARQYRSGDYANYDRNVVDARVGIGFTPGEIPLRIW